MRSAVCQCQQFQPVCILVQCGQVVNSSALEPMVVGSVTSQQIWDQFLAASAGDFRTCAVRSDGQLVCFGANGCGQCDVPADLGPVLAVAAGRFHTCAVRADGQLVCFGDNDDWRCDVPADLVPVLAVAAGSFSYLCSASRWSARLLWTQ